MDSNLSVSGAVLGILVFILVFRKWKPLSLIEWIGAFLFAGTIGSLLGWLWNILTPTQRESYMIYLTVGLVGLVLLHLGDVISDSAKEFLAKLSPGPNTEKGYEPGCSYVAFGLLLVALVFITEPYLHLMENLIGFLDSVYNQALQALQNFDAEIGNKFYLIIWGLLILFVAYVFYTGRRRNSTVRQIWDEFMSPGPGGCAIPLAIMLILVIGMVCLLN